MKQQVAKYLPLSPRPPFPASRERGSRKSLSACGEGFREGSTRQRILLIGIFALCIILLAGRPIGSPTAAAQGPDTGPYTLQQTLGRGMVRSAAWNPDGSLIAVGGALGIWLYTPELEDVGLLKGHTKAVYGLAFSPDGKRLASASHDMTVRIWDVEAQTELHTLEGHTGLTVAVAWSPDGSTVASGAYDFTVRLWDAETGEAIRVLEGHTGWVNQVAFSPDGSQVISSGFDGTIRVWDATTGDLLDTLPGTAAQWSRIHRAAGGGISRRADISRRRRVSVQMEQKTQKRIGIADVSVLRSRVGRDISRADLEHADWLWSS